MTSERPPSDPILLRVRRGPLVESEHRGALALWREGSLALEAGDVARPHYPRSATKPWQALAVLEILAASDFALSDAEVAVIASSHAGQPLHTEIVEGLLRKGGLGPEALRCGAHPPFHEPTARALCAAGRAPTALHHNCSGKHAGMLLACKAAGWSASGCLDPDHPLQRAIRERLALFCGLAPEALAVGVDGCGAPAFAAPLASVARAFARLGAPGSVAFPEAPWRRLLEAVRREPLAYSGEERFASRLTALLGDRLFMKDGAEGFCGVALRDRGEGFALKILDGAQRPLEPVVSALLLRLLEGRLAEAERRTLAEWAAPPVRTVAGAEAGRLEVVLPEGPAA